MDEAQHLADRVAILREGQIVAQGRTEEIAASIGRSTVIGFALNGGLAMDDVRGAVSGAVNAAGDQVEIQSEHPQRDLYRLLALAEERGVELRELEVRRPNLEDVFLELTGGSAR
jgi:ABC-2 type transport system ATP-binding protein